ncbi:MAG: right-handed parallel beta-helix repeat-containing protein, partial [Microgenomates group bacterium]
MDDMPTEQIIPQETIPTATQNRFPLKWALISVSILVVSIGIILGIRKVNTLNTNAATTKVVKNARLTMKAPSVPQPPLEFGSRASYERYVTSQKIPARVKNNIFVDNKLRFGNSGGTDGTDQNPVDDQLQPMTITSTKIICPDNSTLAGCDYIGGDGLQKAIDEAPTGSETDARRLLLKAGSYTRQTATPFSTIFSDGSIGKRQALFLTSGDGGINPKYIEITSESGEENTLIDGFNSIGADGIVISAGRTDISKITLKGIHEFNYDLVDYKYECPKDKTCSSGRAILLSNSAKSRITHTRITDATFASIQAFDSSQLFIKNTVLGGRFRCLIFFDNSSGVVANNTCQSPYQGLTFSSQSRAIKIINNISSKAMDTQDRKNFPKKCDVEAGFSFSGGCAEVNQQNPNTDFRANWTYGFKYGFGGFEKASQWLTPDKLNRVADPMFVDPEHGDFHLKPNSPAKTAGVGGVEIGAYGTVQSPKSVKTISVLTYLSVDGTTAYVSECEGLKGPTNLADCAKPTQYSLTQIRQNAPANQSYVGISN